jgi:hypothetical protein
MVNGIAMYTKLFPLVGSSKETQSGPALLMLPGRVPFLPPNLEGQTPVLASHHPLPKYRFKRLAELITKPVSPSDNNHSQSFHHAATISHPSSVIHRSTRQTARISDSEPSTEVMNAAQIVQATSQVPDTSPRPRHQYTPYPILHLNIDVEEDPAKTGR